MDAKKQIYRVIRKCLPFLLCVLAWVPIRQAHADESLACKNITIPRKNQLYIADENFHPIQRNIVDLGEVDFSDVVTIKKSYYVVAASNISADVGMGGRTLEVSLRDIGTKCNGIHVSAIDFTFDTSPLPPGSFSIEYPFFGIDKYGRPATDIGPIKIQGSIKRIWISSETQANRSQLLLILKNSGNKEAPPLVFSDLPMNFPIQVKKNSCHGKNLRPGETCDIEMIRNQEKLSIPANTPWTINFKDSNGYAQVFFGIESEEVRSFIINRY